MIRIGIVVVTAALGLLMAPYATAQSSRDVEEIRHSLLKQFDRPEERLSVDPIVVQEDVAIASWAQGDMGGRALLRRKAGIWGIVLCSGDALKQADALESFGIPKSKAETLASELIGAEGRLNPSRVALFSRFDDTVMMDAAAEGKGAGGNSHP